MRRLSLAALAVSLILVCLPNHGAADESYYVTVTDFDSLVVRSAPNINGAKIGSFPKYSRLRLHENGETWHLVSGLKEGYYLKGWIKAPNLSRMPKRLAIGPVKGTYQSANFMVKTPREVEAAIAKQIETSIAQYNAPCACPYQEDVAGTTCLERSAWSSAGGSAPVCFADEISVTDLDRYFAQAE